MSREECERVLGTTLHSAVNADGFTRYSDVSALVGIQCCRSGCNPPGSFEGCCATCGTFPTDFPLASSKSTPSPEGFILWWCWWRWFGQEDDVQRRENDAHEDDTIVSVKALMSNHRYICKQNPLTTHPYLIPTSFIRMTLRQEWVDNLCQHVPCP